jgi:hypothetical protein
MSIIVELVIGRRIDEMLFKKNVAGGRATRHDL